MGTLTGRWHLPVIVTLVSMSFSTLSAESAYREAGAHGHGHGSLNVVADENEFAIEVRMAGVNVVGFEHEPSTDAQRAKIKQTIETFRDAHALFVPSASAACEIEKVDVSLGAIGHHEDAHSDVHDKHGEDKREKHARASEDHEEQQEGESHSELHASHAFHCAHPVMLEDLDVRVFEYLREADRLSAQVVTPSVQGAAELTPKESLIRLVE